MATMCSLFFSFLFIAVCPFVGVGDDDVNIFFMSSCRTGSSFFSVKKEPKSSSLGSLAALSSTSFRFGRTLVPPTTIAKISFDHSRKCKGCGFSSLKPYRPRPLFQDGAGCTDEAFAVFLDNDTIRTMTKYVASAGRGMQEGRDVVASRHSDAVLVTFDKTKVSCPSGKEDRKRIIATATAELGIKEATGNNDGKRVEEYLRYTGLGKGHAWCAAFVSWCFGQVGLKEPQNPWSPALFPNARTYWKQGRFVNSQIRKFAIADVFGLYSSSAKRINHVGLVKAVQDKYLISIEGNSNNRVESKRRHLSTIYALSDWVERSAR